MAGFYYHDFGAGRAGQDDSIEARLRTDQLRRALHEASGLRSAPPGTVPRAVRAVNGELLDEDDPGGDSARVIDAEGYGGGASETASRKGLRTGKRRPR
ncbi:MAG: hypothetical protein WEB56_11400 [Roseovarius sp.]